MEHVFLLLFFHLRGFLLANILSQPTACSESFVYVYKVLIRIIVICSGSTMDYASVMKITDFPEVILKNQLN